MMKKLKEMRKDQKGFTLVELIVVLVILAILAAMLVPALLGYIDRARQGKYNEEVHSIYTALQVINDERYAKGGNPLGMAGSGLGGDTTTGELKELNDMIAPSSISATDKVNVNTVTAKNKDDYTVKTFSVVFKSQDQNHVLATFDNQGNITIVNADKLSNTTVPTIVAAPTVAPTPTT